MKSQIPGSAPAGDCLCRAVRRRPGLGGGAAWPGSAIRSKPPAGHGGARRMPNPRVTWCLRAAGPIPEIRPTAAMPRRCCIRRGLRRCRLADAGRSRERAGPPPPLRGVHDCAGAARPVIAICIDDLGEDLAGTDKAMALPRGVALSFLPFAETTPFLARGGGAQGPCGAGACADGGAGRAESRADGAEARHGGGRDRPAPGLDLARVPGLVGINNHEGSRFTADAAGAGAGDGGAARAASVLLRFPHRAGPQAMAAARAAG